jgi:hypothetical protein
MAEGQRPHVDVGQGPGEATAGEVERRLRDVDGDERDAWLAGEQAAEQDLRLRARAGAELHYGERPVHVVRGAREDAVRGRGEDRGLRAGEVVLGNGGDLLVQRGPARVVEEVGGEGLRSRREPPRDVLHDGVIGVRALPAFELERQRETSTPFQNATRSWTSSAPALGVG